MEETEAIAGVDFGPLAGLIGARKGDKGGLSCAIAFVYPAPMKSLAAALACASLLSSCYTIQHDYAGTREVTPGTVLSQPSESLGAVQSKDAASFLFWGLLDLKDGSAPAALEQASREQYGKDFDGITRVSIHEEMEAIDVVLTAVTLGIYTRITVTAEGQAERFAAKGGAQ